MLRITKQTDYGILLANRMAGEDEQPWHNARDLAAEVGLPVPMVSKILKGLTREGLLESQRGVKGGYRLARPADGINMRELIEALEGPLGITECAPERGGDCEHESRCPVRGNWQRINVAIARALEAISLADMALPLLGVGAPDPGIGPTCGPADDAGRNPLNV